MALKPTAWIHDWMYLDVVNRLYGRVSDHPRQSELNDGHALTSKIVSAPDGIKPGGRVETENTWYVLGQDWESQKKFEEQNSVESKTPVSA